MAFTVYMPSDRGIHGANFVVTGSTGGRSSVFGDFGSFIIINNHTLDEVRVVVVLIIDNGEDLSLHTSFQMSIERVERKDSVNAENTIVERSLVLIGSTTGSGSRVGPVNLVCLSNYHVFTVLPVIWGGKLGIGLIIMTTLETQALLGTNFVGSTSILVVLSLRTVLGTDVEVNIDGT